MAGAEGSAGPWGLSSSIHFPLSPVSAGAASYGQANLTGAAVPARGLPTMVPLEIRPTCAVGARTWNGLCRRCGALLTDREVQ
jgi:hypothetical protein